MQTIETITARRSIRSYKPDPVPRSLIEEIFDTARWAPSWKNSQTVRYLIVDDPDVKQTILETNLPSYNRRVIQQAPVLIVMTTKTGVSGYHSDGTPNSRLGDGWQMFDAGVAAQTVCLAARDKGLGTLIMGIYDEENLPKLLHLEPGYLITALIALGYAGEEPKGPGRKQVSELIEYL